MYVVRNCVCLFESVGFLLCFRRFVSVGLFPSVCFRRIDEEHSLQETMDGVFEHVAPGPSQVGDKAPKNILFWPTASPPPCFHNKSTPSVIFDGHKKKQEHTSMIYRYILINTFFLRLCFCRIDQGPSAASCGRCVQASRTYPFPIGGQGFSEPFFALPTDRPKRCYYLVLGVYLHYKSTPIMLF